MNKFAAGIVLYNPDIERLRTNIKHIIHQVEYLVLIDNHCDNIKEIITMVEGNSKVKLISNEKNCGIAKALNQIVIECLDKEYEWVLTLDQDSVCPNDMVSTYERYIKNEKVAILTPNIKDINEEKKIVKHEKKFEYVDRCITSGSLMDVKLCREIGYFDEKMFIDYVDFDYCIRITQIGYKIIKVNEVSMIHEVGKAKRIDLLYNIGKKLHIKKFQKYFFTYNHSAIRTYYYARNSIYFIKKHKNILNSKGEYKILMKWALLKLIFEKEKCKKFSAIIKGIRDGKSMSIR